MTDEDYMNSLEQGVYPGVKSVKDGKNDVDDGSYQIALRNCQSCGIATAEFTFSGNYQGTKEVAYTIAGKKLSKLKFSKIKDRTVVLDGDKKPMEICPEPGHDFTITDANNQPVVNNMNEATKYRIEYFNNREVGKASVLIKGCGIYEGTVVLPFKIVKRKVSDKYILAGNDNSKNDIEEVDFYGPAAVPEKIKVIDTKRLNETDDGKLEYVNIALKECKKYCRKLSDWYKKSVFKPKNAEVVFGDGADAKNGYPAVELLNGKVKLFGKIDRVDEYKDYVRIIDYKTGGKEVKDDKIFVGVKLQLYLYSLAIKDKILAGAYYLRVNDEYKTTEDKDKPLLEGKTANVDEIVSAGEEAFIPLGGKDNAVEVSKIAAVQKYVKALAEQAAKQMEDGVIVPSPFEGTCNICQFSPICKLRLKERKAFSVDTEYLAASAECAESRDENKDGAL